MENKSVTGVREEPKPLTPDVDENVAMVAAVNRTRVISNMLFI